MNYSVLLPAVRLGIILAAVLVFILAPVARAGAPDLPQLTEHDLSSQERIATFVAKFLRHDPQAKELLNPSNTALFRDGSRPRIGVPNDPESGGKKLADLSTYFAIKLYLDLNSIRPLNESTFRSFVDQVGTWGNATLTCAGEIGMKYDLKVEGKFNFQTELAKVPAGSERDTFKQCWLNDAVLGTELRMLAWSYRQLFGTPYLSPHDR